MDVLLQTNDAASPGFSTGRLLRLPEVIARVGLKRSAIYQRMNDGRFPRSRSLGPKCTVWVEAEIDEWIRDIAGRTV
jgi:prophage regulatory protein